MTKVQIAIMIMKIFRDITEMNQLDKTSKYYILTLVISVRVSKTCSEF